ncbi:glutaredoxin family protein [Massilia horti]|uniref:Glutaredoxin domain-containing protein n=1 Tax=Massilia horti TaxID=2562153 RepID=A0A4Y9SZM6_9BURK|nr:glutaredoxin domain-containing protein [Massilia horti]TFW30196.1 hypothetical protein E4O92_17260 [Massilia horti]
MTIICPKCRHVRPKHATNPEWQCPACGVCYAKVRDGQPVDVRRSERHPATESEWGIPWGRLILLAVLGWGAWNGYHRLHNSPDRPVAAELSPAAIAALAKTVEPGEVVMYSTTECVYCAQAKAWLSRYGFAFTECNMSISRQCEREFLSYSATGTPFLLVRGHQMKDGFGSDEFLGLLQRNDAGQLQN